MAGTKRPPKKGTTKSKKSAEPVTRVRRRNIEKTSVWVPSGRSWGDETHFARGMNAERTGNLEEARDAYRMAIREEDGGTGAELRLLEVLSQLEDHAGVLALADKLEARGVGSVVIGTTKARALLATDRPREAIAAARQALEIDRDHVAAWIPMALSHRATDDSIAAVEAGEQIVRLSPTWSWAWFSLAYDLSNLGRYQEATDAAIRATELDPDDGDAWFNLACYRAQLQRDAEALEALERAILCDPENAAIAMTDADLARLRGDSRFRALCRV